MGDGQHEDEAAREQARKEWNDPRAVAARSEFIDRLARESWPSPPVTWSPSESPWRLTQNLAGLASGAPEPWVDELLDRALQTAAAGEDCFQRVAVLAWVIRAARYCGRRELALKVYHGAIAESGSVTPAASRAVALLELLKEAKRLGEVDIRIPAAGVVDAAMQLRSDPVKKWRKWGATYLHYLIEELGQQHRQVAVELLAERQGAERAAAVLARRDEVRRERLEQRHRSVMPGGYDAGDRRGGAESAHGGAAQRRAQGIGWFGRVTPAVWRDCLAFVLNKEFALERASDLASLATSAPDGRGDEMLTLAMHAAPQAQDVIECARAYRYIGAAARHCGRPVLAMEVYQRALELSASIAAPAARVTALLGLVEDARDLREVDIRVPAVGVADAAMVLLADPVRKWRKWGATYLHRLIDAMGPEHQRVAEEVMAERLGAGWAAAVLAGRSAMEQARLEQQQRSAER